MPPVSLSFCFKFRGPFVDPPCGGENERNLSTGKLRRDAGTATGRMVTQSTTQIVGAADVVLSMGDRFAEVQQVQNQNGASVGSSVATDSVRDWWLDVFSFVWAIHAYALVNSWIICGNSSVET